MNDPFVPRVGGIMSADIAVPQHEQEIQFYARVLCTGANPLWREDLMNNLGMPIIGLGACSAKYADLPLQWMPHIQVADVAKSVERALALGGSEVLHGKSDDGQSQWAVLLDPNGAAFGIIPVVSEVQIPQKTEAVTADNQAAAIACISWLDLTVTNASKTRDFYQSVIGWSVRDIEVKGIKSQDTSERYTDFQMLGDDDIPTAAIRQARCENLGLPAVWLLYLPVGDIGESLHQVRQGGGKIIKQTVSLDGVLVSAVIEDPVGVSLALVPG